MKKGLKLNKQLLEEMYINQKLSLVDIAKKFDCKGTNILYWLKKYEIKRRPAYPKKIHIDKNILEDYYINKKLRTQEIADIFGIKNARTIRKKLEKYGIERKTISEALTRKFKKDFSGNLLEKSFLLGLRAGDFHAKSARKSIRIQTSTTHLAQIDLLKNSLRDYGELRKYHFKSKNRDDEWFIYIDLNQSFEFLLKKPTEIQNWILKNDEYFLSFLTSYSDCESNWHTTKNHDVKFRYTFRLRTGDKIILEQIKEKLESLGFSPLLSIVKNYNKSSKIKTNISIYSLILNKKKDNLKLIDKMLPLSKHSEKIRKMRLILDNKDKSWQEVEPTIEKLKEEIKKEILKNT